MNYNEFVTQPIAIWRKILHKKDELVKLESLCLIANMGMTERVQTSMENTREKNLLAYAQAEQDFNALISLLLKAQADVREFLYDTLEPQEADILEWKYVNLKSIRQIASLIGVEEQTARNKISKCDKKARKLYIEYEKV